MSVTAGLAARLAHTDPRLLLPHETPNLPDRLDLVAAVPLPSGSTPMLIVVARDPAGLSHVVPVVDDATGLRRARPGDGLAVATLDLLSRGGSGEGFRVRRGRADLVWQASAESAVREDGDDRELFDLGEVRLAVSLEPAVWDGEVPDTVGALDRAGFRGTLPWIGDLVVGSGGVPGFGPVAMAAVRPAQAHGLSDRFIDLVAQHLRGGGEAEPTLELAARVGRSLAELHAAAERLPEPMTTTARVTDDMVAEWRRTATDAFAEAVVLAEGEPGERLRARRAEVRAAIDGFAVAAGSPLLPALSPSGPGSFVVLDGRVLLDPLRLAPVGQRWQPPVRDVAVVVRGIDRLARTVHRRLVAGGYPAPTERVVTWFQAVRQGLLDAYGATLAASGTGGWLDDRLLLAFEVEAECRALSRASRYLSTARGVSDAALADLLG